MARALQHVGRRVDLAWLTIALLPLAAIAAGAAVVLSPAMTMLALGLLMAALVFVWRPQLLVSATMILGCAAMPAAVPYSVNLAGISVLIYEPTLVLAALWAAARFPGSRLADKRLTLFVAVVAAWAAYGLVFRDARLGPVIGDVRGLLDLGVAFFVASRLVGTPYVRQALTAVRVALWWSAALILGASLTGLELLGRAEAASLGIAGATSNAARFLTAATFPALAVLAAVVALVAVGRAQVRATWSYWAPCLVILLLAYSRNSILGVAVAVLFAVLCARNDKQMGAALTRGVVAAGVIALVALLGPTITSALPADSWVATQIAGYSNRVLGGIQSDTLARDPSALFREKENEHMARAVARNPVVGHGFGYAYKPPRGPAGQFEAVTAPYYAHQFYLWLTMKTGVLGAALILWVFFAPLGRALRTPTAAAAARIALGAAAAALLAVSWVAPLPIGVPTGMLVGAVLGALTVAAARRRDDAAPLPEDAEGGGAEVDVVEPRLAHVQVDDELDRH